MEFSMENTENGYQPFIKWVGGKRALVKTILSKAKITDKNSFNSYFEPFLGGGAMFFYLKSSGSIKPGAEVCLSDVNGPLINTYRVIKEDVQNLINELLVHQRNHTKTSVALKNAMQDVAASIGGGVALPMQESKRARVESDYYYFIRDAIYNRIKQDHLPGVNNIFLAAAFLYLNRTGFNGMYRENSKGEMNIPKGRYTNPAIVNDSVLRLAHDALKDVDLQCHGYEHALRKAKKGDLVYLDPPYFETFTDYSQDGFGLEQQEHLAELAAEAAERGAKIIISNSDTRKMEKLYKKHDFEVVKIQAARNINSDGQGRAKVSEIVAFRTKQI